MDSCDETRDQKKTEGKTDISSYQTHEDSPWGPPAYTPKDFLKKEGMNQTSGINRKKKKNPGKKQTKRPDNTVSERGRLLSCMLPTAGCQAGGSAVISADL